MHAAERKHAASNGRGEQQAGDESFDGRAAERAADPQTIGVDAPPLVEGERNGGEKHRGEVLHVADEDVGGGEVAAEMQGCCDLLEWLVQ
jgi:hypothetical protein